MKKNNANGYSFISEEIKNKVVEMYKDESIPVTDISKRFGISSSSVSNIIKKAGVPLRRPKETEYTRVCQYCKRNIALREIRFCPYCGKDIRTRDEILKFTVKRLYSYQSLLPAGSREEYSKIIREILQGVDDLSKEVP